MTLDREPEVCSLGDCTASGADAWYHDVCTIRAFEIASLGDGPRLCLTCARGRLSENGKQTLGKAAGQLHLPWYTLTFTMVIEWLLPNSITLNLALSSGTLAMTFITAVCAKCHLAELNIGAL